MNTQDKIEEYYERHIRPLLGSGEVARRLEDGLYEVFVGIPSPKKRLEIPIEDVFKGVSPPHTRAYNCLRATGILDLRELTSYSEDDLLQLRNFGGVTLNIIKRALEEHGLKLRGSTP